MDKKNSSINFCVLNNSSVEELVRDLFSPSKNKLKQFFSKEFLLKKLKAKDVLSLPLDFVNDKEINPTYIGPELETIFEDESFLVLNKPSDIFIHPLTYDEKNNCLSYIRSKNLASLKVNVLQYDRGLLYRLDYETSGVIVFVKKEDDYLYLRSSFNQLAKEKIYKALVSGEFYGEKILETFLRPYGPNGQKMVLGNEKNGEKAKLQIINSEYLKEIDKTLLTIKLHQGLRHQIRAQLSIAGHPIVGDELYGGIQYKRLCLHAYKYTFDFKNKEYCFQSDLFNFQ